MWEIEHVPRISYGTNFRRVVGNVVGIPWEFTFFDHLGNIHYDVLLSSHKTSRNNGGTIKEQKGGKGQCGKCHCQNTVPHMQLHPGKM